MSFPRLRLNPRHFQLVRVLTDSQKMILWDDLTASEAKQALSENLPALPNGCALLIRNRWTGEIISGTLDTSGVIA